MKRLLMVFSSLVLLCSCCIAFAAPNEGTRLNQLMDSIGGVWCDKSGHRPVNFSDNKLNGLRISDAQNFAGDKYNGSATITILGKEGTQFVNVYWSTVAGKKTLSLGDSLTFTPKTSDIKHPETVGGLSLDMTMDEVENKYGGNERILTPLETRALCGIDDISWYYENIGLIVTFDNNTFTVDRLIILKGASTAFDRSVLNADSPLDKYAGIYGWKKNPAPGDVLNLGAGEDMSFVYYPQLVMLKLSDVN